MENSVMWRQKVSKEKKAQTIIIKDLLYGEHAREWPIIIKEILINN
jgi:hypothetical protein